MKIYLVTRIDHVDWCEDYAKVVVAADEMWAEKLARLSCDEFRKAKLKVKEIDLTQEGVILSANTGA